MHPYCRKAWNDHDDDHDNKDKKKDDNKDDGDYRAWKRDRKGSPRKKTIMPVKQPIPTKSTLKPTTMKRVKQPTALANITKKNPITPTKNTKNSRMPTLTLDANPIWTAKPTDNPARKPTIRQNMKPTPAPTSKTRFRPAPIPLLSPILKPSKQPTTIKRTKQPTTKRTKKSSLKPTLSMKSKGRLSGKEFDYTRRESKGSIEHKYPMEQVRDGEKSNMSSNNMYSGSEMGMMGSNVVAKGVVAKGVVTKGVIAKGVIAKGYSE